MRRHLRRNRRSRGDGERRRELLIDPRMLRDRFIKPGSKTNHEHGVELDHWR